MGIFGTNKKSDKWQFPSGLGLTLTGINLAGIDTFSDIPINSITREGIQNSLDAKDVNIDGPVIVSFSASEVNASEIPGVDKIRKEILPAMRKKWPDSETAIDFLNNYENVINQETVPVLKISDYNTKGLAEKNWQSLIFVAGDSVKDDEASAGSKGIGKFAPFAASNLRMVFYHTVSQIEGERTIGVSQLISFDAGKSGEVTQGPGYFSSGLEGGQYKPMDGNLPFDVDRTSAQLGTDLLIVGFKNDSDWQDLIKESVLSNFLISIWTGELEVHIGEEVINKGKLQELFTYFNKIEHENQGKHNAFRLTEEFKDSMRAYKVLIDRDAKNFDLPDEMIQKYDFIDSAKDGRLSLALLDDTNRKVLQTRKSGMKINYRNRISGSINFFGVFQAKGQNLNKFLKDIENANHDDWYVDRITDKKKKKVAKEFLKELVKFYKNSVLSAFAIDNSESMDVFGLDKILTVRGENQRENEEENLNLRKKVSEVKIKKNNPKRKTLRSKTNKNNQIIDKVFGGDESEDKKPRGSERREPADENNSEPKSKRNVEKRGAELNDIKVRLIEINPESGEYRINVRVPKKKNKFELELQVTGENGSNEKVIIKSANVQNAEILSDSSLLLTDVQKNQLVTGTVFIDSDSRIRLGGKAFEIKG